MGGSLANIPLEHLPKNPEQLPGELRNVAELIAEVLVMARPDLAGDAAMLAARSTFAIADAYRGTAIYCHNLGTWWRQYRDGMIIEEFDRRTTAGETATKVVKEMAGREWPGDQRRICERSVWLILGKPDPRQLGLWG